jgi:uncharacterized protein
MLRTRRQCLEGLGLGALALGLPRIARAGGPIVGKQQYERYSVNQGEVQIVTSTGHHPLLVTIINDPQSPDSPLKEQHPIDPDEGVLYTMTVVQPIQASNADVPFPTDIMFMIGDGRIVEIHPQIMPNDGRLLVSNIPVKAALQMLAGTVRRFDIVPGDHVLHEVFGRTI